MQARAWLINRFYSSVGATRLSQPVALILRAAMEQAEPIENILPMFVTVDDPRVRA